MKFRQPHLLWPVVLASNLLVSASDIGIAASTNDGPLNDGSFIPTNVDADAEPGTAASSAISDIVDPMGIGIDERSLESQVADHFKLLQQHEMLDTDELLHDEGDLLSRLVTKSNHSDEIATDDPSFKLMGTRELRELGVKKVKEVEEDQDFHMGPDGGDELGVSTTTANYDYFRPLDCNANLDTETCTNLSANLPGNTNNPLTVPCGKCYKYDLGEGEFTFNGILISGTLETVHVNLNLNVIAMRCDEKGFSLTP